MSRMLRAVRHLRQDATKFKFSVTIQQLQIHLEEPAEIAIDLTRGPRRVRAMGSVSLGKGENSVRLDWPLECKATLFRPKPSHQGSGGVLKRGKQKEETTAPAADAAASAADEFLPKEAKLQLMNLSRSRRVPLRLQLSRSRLSPSASSASVLSGDPSAAASSSLAPGASPEANGDKKEAFETGVFLDEASFDLTALVAAERQGKRSLQLRLAKTNGFLTVSFSCAKAEGIVDDDDNFSVYSTLLSPPTASAVPPLPAGRDSPSTNPPAAEPAAMQELLVLRLPHKETLPSMLETTDPLEDTSFAKEQQQQQQQQAAAATSTAASKLQRPSELVSTDTPTTPTEHSPEESHQQQQQQQRQDELLRKDELIASLQRQVAFLEAEDRQAAGPQLAQLFAQIDELHTALAAAQEQQLAAAEQLQEQREKGDLSAAAAALQQQLQAVELRLQQQEQQNQELLQQQQEMQQRIHEQQQQLLLLQAERDGIQLIADAYKKQLEEVQQRQQQQHQQPKLLQEERLVLLLQQQEEEKRQLEIKLAEEIKEKEAATNELRLLQQLLQEQQEQQQHQLLQQTDGTSDATAALREQLVALQRQVAEGLEARESLRLSKDKQIQSLTETVQALQHKHGETQALQQQTLKRLATATEQTESLREKVRCQEEALQRLPTQAAWSCAQQQHQLLLQQQREWQQQHQRQQEIELAEKGRRIEELEKELVFAKVELAAAEQRRHEDIDAFKKKLQQVKHSVLAYAAASSNSNLQSQASLRPERDRGLKGSPVKRLVPINHLKAFFRSNPQNSSSSSNSKTAATNAAVITGAAPIASTSSTKLIKHSSFSNSSSSSGRVSAATVSLFGNQGSGKHPAGPSVTRFSVPTTGP